MKTQYQLICLIFACFAMASCSMLDDSGVMAEDQQTTRVDLTKPSFASYSADSDQVGYRSGFDDQAIADAKAQYPDNRIQVFSLDDAAPRRFNYDATSSAESQSSLAKRYTPDSRVQFYSLDADSPARTATPSAPASITPYGAVPAPSVSVATIDTDLLNPSAEDIALAAAAIQEQEEVAVSIEPQEEVEEIVPYNMQFAYGVSSLNAEKKAALGKAKADMAGLPLSVEGHASKRADIADPVQRQIANFKVSVDRAFSVTKALIEQGVPANMIELRAYGEGRPVAEGSDSALNQRVEVRAQAAQ